MNYISNIISKIRWKLTTQAIYIVVGCLFALCFWAVIVEANKIQWCISTHEDMTVKKIKRIQTICDEEIKRMESIQEEYQSFVDNITIIVWGESKKKVTSDYIHQHLNALPPVWGSTPKERLNNLVSYYASGFDVSVFIEARNKHGIPEELLACIAYADSTLGKFTKSTNNITNYWNNDRGDTRSYASVLENVMETAEALRQWWYLGKLTKIWELSEWWRTALWLPSCSVGTGNPCYATSPVNRRWNVNDCMTFIHGENKDRDNFTFKK
jgi:hypothetical protein